MHQQDSNNEPKAKIAVARQVIATHRWPGPSTVHQSAKMPAFEGDRRNKSRQSSGSAYIAHHISSATTTAPVSVFGLRKKSIRGINHTVAVRSRVLRQCSRSVDQQNAGGADKSIRQSQSDRRVGSNGRKGRGQSCRCQNEQRGLGACYGNCSWFMERV